MVRERLLPEVADVIRRVAAEVILPRFGHLRSDEVTEKEPGELVTVADADAEAALTEALRRLDPAAAVVGEEAMATNPSILDLARGSDRVWVIDPLDGTRNMVAGSPDFAVMVALIEGGTTVASWIYQPVADQMFTASRGGGAQLDGARLSPKPRPTELAALRGVVRTGFLSPADAEAVTDRIGAFGPVDDGSGAAGIEYPRVILGAVDFVLYWRTLVWDHAPGALLLQEAGGSVTRIDGSPYEPWSDRSGLLLAATPTMGRAVLDVLAPDGHL